MSRTIKNLIPAFIAVVLFFLNCSGPDIAGGGTIETTNGVVGVIRNSDNTPHPILLSNSTQKITTR